VQQPWQGLSYHSGNKIKPCCEWFGDMFSGTVQEYIDSDYLKSIKKQMMSTELPKTCVSCVINERSNIPSYRQFENSFADLESLNIETGTSFKILDYRPDIICNFKCRMCSSQSSSLIMKELIDNPNLMIWDKLDSQISNNHDILNSIDLKQLKVVSILGGEPSISQTVFDFLDKLYEANTDVELQLTTNGSNINDKWISRVKKFKKISYTISVDATGKCYEYIRTNGHWSTIERNMKRLDDLGIPYGILCTMMSYNLAMIEDWFDWFGNRDAIGLSHVVSPSDLSIKSIPPEIRNEKIIWLENKNNKLADQIVNLINDKTMEYDAILMKKMFERTAAYDQARGTNIFDLDPVFARMYSMINI